MNLTEITKNLYSRPLVLAAVSVAAGIIAGDSGGSYVIPIISLMSVFGIGSYFESSGKQKKYERLKIIILVFICFFAGFFRMNSIKTTFSEQTFPEKSQKDVNVSGYVEDISLGKEQFILTLDNPELKTGDTDIKNHGKLLVYAENAENVKIGDLISTTGTLYSFSLATNYGQFDQRKYYLARGITLKLYADDILIHSKRKSIVDSVKNTLFNISQSFMNGLKSCFDKKDKGILAAMLVGNKSELDDSTKGIYQRMGIAHVLSISGLHITLIGMGLFGFLKKISSNLKFSIYSSCVIILLYGLLTGFSVSTIRAVIMFICMLTARLLGEAYDGQSAAGLSCVIIMMMNPAELYEAGFQLTFVAVFGIFAGNEIRNNLKIKNRFIMFILPAVCAEIATFPVILRNYYSFSPYSLFANIILVPFMPVIVLSGFISGIFGSLYVTVGGEFFDVVSGICAGSAHYFLSLYENVSEYLLKLPGADVITGSPDIGRCVIYYGLLFIGVYISENKEVLVFIERIGRKFIKNIKSKKDIKNKKEFMRPVFIMLYVALISLMFVCILYKPEESGLNVNNIDVGQGLSVYIEADGKSMLADGGSSNVKGVGKYRIEPFLLWKGVSRLDYCFVSHTDEDHISGIKELIESGRIDIGALVIGVNYRDDEPLIALAREKGIKIIKAEKKCIINNNVDLFSDKKVDNSTECVIEVLSPDSGIIYEDKNQASLVFVLKYGNASMLFTGDSDEYAESEYVKYLKGQHINILQCPHHGSKYSSSELLLRTIKPDITVISCSKTNVYGHPAPETLERLQDAGSEYYITSECGMITVNYDGKETINVRKYKE